MTNTRIRYTKAGVNLVSRQAFQVNETTSVKVVLNSETMKYDIVDATDESNVLASGGNTKNLSVLKIQAKRNLKAMGLEFNTESRNRG